MQRGIGMTAIFFLCPHSKNNSASVFTEALFTSNF